jgi:hypothetical protein
MADNFYTQTDWMNAGLYAGNKIKETLCLNPDIQQRFPGIDWVPDKSLQGYNCPLALRDCADAAGHCKFMTKEACLAQSGDFKDQGSGKKPYLEWHPELKGSETTQGQQIGKCILGNFALRDWCENPHSRRAGQFVPGVTNVPPFDYDQTTGICSMTKPYCDYMGVGFTKKNDDLFKETGLSLPDCHEGTWQKLAEKVTGKVLFRGMKRGLLTKFLKDAVESGTVGLGPYSYYKFIQKTMNGDFEDDLGINKDYSGIEDFVHEDKLKQDKVKEGIQKFREAFRENMERGIQSMKILPSVGHSQIKDITAVCDPKAMLKKQFLVKDFGGDGVNLYLITWNEDYMKDNPESKLVQYGFICDELAKSGLPIVKKGKYKAVALTKTNTQNNKFLRRVYLIYAFPDWIFSFFSNAIVDTQLLNEILKD